MSAQVSDIAGLIPFAPVPDHATRIPLADFRNELHDVGMGPIATFTGIGYELAVYLVESGSRKACAVAPSYIGGPPSAMATADVRYFEFDVWDLQPLAYARACLWALRETALDAERETRA